MSTCGALLCVAPSVDSWKKRRMNPKPGPVLRYRLTESSLAPHLAGRAQETDKESPGWAEDRVSFGVTGPIHVQLLGRARAAIHPKNKLSSPDRLVALADKCHPTLQRS
jgi:hypothetical protein